MGVTPTIPTKSSLLVYYDTISYRKVTEFSLVELLGLPRLREEGTRRRGKVSVRGTHTHRPPHPLNEEK